MDDYCHILSFPFLPFSSLFWPDHFHPQSYLYSPYPSLFRILQFLSHLFCTPLFIPFFPCSSINLLHFFVITFLTSTLFHISFLFFSIFLPFNYFTSTFIFFSLLLNSRINLLFFRLYIHSRFSRDYRTYLLIISIFILNFNILISIQSLFIFPILHVNC